MGDAGPGGVSDGGLGRGDRVVRVDPAQRRRALRELLLLWLVVLLLIRGVAAVHAAAFFPGFLQQVVLALVPLLFIYAPVLVCRWREVDSWSYRLSIPAFRDWPAWREVFRLAGLSVLVVMPPFFVGYHLYQTRLFGITPGEHLPEDLTRLVTPFLTLIAYQVFYVAIPEEFFYRGYFQTRLNEVFPRKFLAFGAPFGWGAILANLFFAFGHSIVQFQWWHFATFFPGLVFAWLRERTGGVTAGALFHAACNITVTCLDVYYGLRSPFQG